LSSSACFSGGRSSLANWMNPQAAAHPFLWMTTARIRSSRRQTASPRRARCGIWAIRTQARAKPALGQVLGLVFWKMWRENVSTKGQYPNLMQIKLGSSVLRDDAGVQRYLLVLGEAHGHFRYCRKTDRSLQLWRGQAVYDHDYCLGNCRHAGWRLDRRTAHMAGIEF